MATDRTKPNLPPDEEEEVETAVQEPAPTQEPYVYPVGDGPEPTSEATIKEWDERETRQAKLKVLQIQFETLPAKYSTTHLGIACMYVHQSISGTSTPANVAPYNQLLDATDIALVEMFGGGQLIQAAATLLATGRF